MAAKLSVIIPTLNEKARLAELLEYLKRSEPHEIIVADGGSSDQTLEIAKTSGVRVISAPTGRAVQINLAAAMATGEFLLFLHADTLPPPGYPQIIRRLLQMPGTSAGAFRFELAGNLAAATLIEPLVNLRCHLLRILSRPEDGPENHLTLIRFSAANRSTAKRAIASKASQ